MRPMVRRSSVYVHTMMSLYRYCEVFGSESCHSQTVPRDALHIVNSTAGLGQGQDKVCVQAIQQHVKLFNKSSNNSM